mmetsp:Transcript_11978/g.22779  ORF Transcript_11978/g.22779 Transcript_11978/m.22779 type:complete len:88 (-) Transcript_11978:2813-3076(-)
MFDVGKAETVVRKSSSLECSSSFQSVRSLLVAYFFEVELMDLRFCKELGLENYGTCDEGSCYVVVWPIGSSVRRAPPDHDSILHDTT